MQSVKNVNNIIVLETLGRSWLYVDVRLCLILAIVVSVVLNAIAVKRVEPLF